MPLRIEAPDGSIVEFPDGTGDDVIANAMRKTFGGPEAAATPQPTQSGRHLSFEEGVAAMDADNALNTAGTGMMGMLEGVPILGPALKGGVQRAAAGIASVIDGEGYDQSLEQVRATTDEAQRASPAVNTVGQVAGAVGSMIPLGSTALGAKALGITGRNLGTRALASGATSGAISAADAAARGRSAEEIIGSGQIGAGIGAAIPVAGAGVSAAVRGIGNTVGPRVQAIFSPAQEAERRVGVAVSRDAAGNPAGVMSPADEAVARSANIPVVNADRGGEVTRALARSAANQSPEARAAIEKTASDRFGAQSQRAVDFVKKVTGGNVDDLAYQENIRKVAAATNRPAYAAAEAAPEAQSMFSPRMQELMQSPTFRRAVDEVPKRSADRGAIEGYKAIGNPFTQNSQGAYVLRRSADGSLVTPNLRFWDQVQRNLRSEADRAFRSGDNQTYSEIKALRDALVGDLDSTVPAFKAARTGAAGFFGAEDALEAGRKFATQPRAIPEARKAYAGFKGPEKDAFATGYASEIIDRIKASGDRTNVINSVFKSQASRESLELALGPQRAKEIEAYVRVEDLVDRLRGSMGNSTTARQLVEMGIGAGGGYGVTGDWKGAIAGAALAKGARYVGERADARVMENIATLLTKDDAGALNGAVQFAARNPKYMAALEQLSNALSVPARGAAVAIGGQ